MRLLKLDTVNILPGRSSGMSRIECIELVKAQCINSTMSDRLMNNEKKEKKEALTLAHCRIKIEGGGTTRSAGVGVLD